MFLIISRMMVYGLLEINVRLKQFPSKKPTVYMQVTVNNINFCDSHIMHIRYTKCRALTALKLHCSYILFYVKSTHINMGLDRLKRDCQWCTAKNIVCTAFSQYVYLRACACFFLLASSRMLLISLVSYTQRESKPKPETNQIESRRHIGNPDNTIPIIKV